MVASAGRSPWSALALGLLALSACNVPEPPASSGGVHVDEGPCGRGVVIVESDYASTNVALASFEGDTLSPSFLSSAAQAPGLSMALSGDVVLPSTRPLSRRVVLIDRYPNAVLTWIDPETAAVQAQLSVASGFASNPHDYLELGDGRAYVTRYESNPSPGREPWDAGGDLLVLRLDPPAIVGRIDLAGSDDGALLPRADRMLRLGGHALVLLQRFDPSFTAVGDTRIAGVDVTRDQVDWLVDLPGLASCGALQRSPSGDTLVVVCSGAFHDQVAQLDRSGVVVFDTTVSPPAELSRFELATRLGAPLAPAIGFLDAHRVIGVAFGDLVEGRGDQAYLLDLRDGAVDVLAHSSDGFVFGDVSCASACGAPCLMADAESMGLRRWLVDGSGGVEALPAALLSDAVGLAPRGLGVF